MNAPNRTASAVLVSWSLFMGAACQANEAGQICEWLGVCDQPSPEPETLIVVCDFSGSSTCSKESLDATAAVALHRIKDRPGSHFEVWMLGHDVATTQSVAQFTILSSERSGRRAIQAYQARQMEDAKRLVQERAEPYFDAAPPSRSPILEALGKISLARSEHAQNPLRIILITDALQYGNDLDFECAPPSSPEELSRLIRVRGILPEGSLLDASITFAFVTLGQIDGGRCPASIDAARRVRKIWQEILTSAGAHSVTFNAGPPNLEALHANSIEEGAER